MPIFREQAFAARAFQFNGCCRCFGRPNPIWDIGIGWKTREREREREREMGDISKWISSPTTNATTASSLRRWSSLNVSMTGKKQNAAQWFHNFFVKLCCHFLFRETPPLSTFRRLITALNVELYLLTFFYFLLGDWIDNSLKLILGKFLEIFCSSCHCCAK